MVDSSGNDSTPKPERETGETRSDSDWLAEILAIDPLRDPSAVLSAQRHWLASRLPEESEMAMRIYSAELALSDDEHARWAMRTVDEIRRQFRTRLARSQGILESLAKQGIPGVSAAAARLVVAAPYADPLVRMVSDRDLPTDLTFTLARIILMSPGDAVQLRQEYLARMRRRELNWLEGNVAMRDMLQLLTQRYPAVANLELAWLKELFDLEHEELHAVSQAYQQVMVHFAIALVSGFAAVAFVIVGILS